MTNADQKGSVPVMRLCISQKSELPPGDVARVLTALEADRPTSEGMLTAWRAYVSNTLFAFFLANGNDVVGVAEASGPRDAVNPGWWIDPKFRGQKLGRELACLLARRVKQQGYTGVRPDVAVLGDHREASLRMLARFRVSFVGR